MGDTVALGPGWCWSPLQSWPKGLRWHAWGGGCWLLGWLRFSWGLLGVSYGRLSPPLFARCKEGARPGASVGSKQGKGRSWVGSGVPQHWQYAWGTHFTPCHLGGRHWVLCQVRVSLPWAVPDGDRALISRRGCKAPPQAAHLCGVPA